MEYTWYIHWYTMYIPRIGYTCYIHGYTMYTTKYIHGISKDIHGIFKHIHGISLMYIRGIYTVYPWIFLDIPSFLKSDFAACPCFWSHSMRTRVWVIKSTLFHAPPWQSCQGKRLTTKGSPNCSQPWTFPLRGPSVAGSGGDGGGGGGVAGVFPFS